MRPRKDKTSFGPKVVFISLRASSGLLALTRDVGERNFWKVKVIRFYFFIWGIVIYGCKMEGSGAGSWKGVREIWKEERGKRKEEGLGSSIHWRKWIWFWKYNGFVGHFTIIFCGLMIEHNLWTLVKKSMKKLNQNHYKKWIKINFKNSWLKLFKEWIVI